MCIRDSWLIAGLEVLFFLLIADFAAPRRTALVAVNVHIVKINLRLAVAAGRLTGTTSTTIAGIGFQLVFWFKFIHLTPH